MLSNKRILVTGATGGLGRELTQSLLEERAQVIAVARTDEKLEQLRDQLGSPESLTTVATDVADTDAVEQLFASLGPVPLDGMVHCVGAYAGGKPIHETSVDDWQKLVTSNLTTTFLVLGACARRMLSQKQAGSIVCVSSVMARSGSAGHSAYAATKAGVNSLVKTSAAELAAQSIRVNAVLPTTIATEANIKAMPDADHSQWVTPHQVSEVIWYLLSNKSTKITGTCIEVAGKDYQPD